MIRTQTAIAMAIAGATSILVGSRALAQTDAPGPEAPPPVTAEPPPAPPPPVQPPPAAPPIQANESPGIGEGEPPPKAKPALPEWLKGVSIGAGVLLWYYQPISLPGASNDVSVFWSRLLIDGKWGIFGLHLEPRIRDTKLRPFYDGPAWLQEAYASVDVADNVQLRLGKTYSRLGLFWYTSFYGNVQVYDGLKLDPDYGATLQGTVGSPDDELGLSWWAQYFAVDGGTNVSLQDRDTISYAGARRRNQAIGRLEPRIKLGTTATLSLGASGEFLQATGLPGLGTQNVWRAAGDLTLVAGGLTLRGEVLRQNGFTVTDFPVAGTAATATAAAVPGQASAHNDYLLVGGEYTFGPVTAVYTSSLGSYNDLGIKEWMHVPAVSVAVSPNLAFLAEVVFWQNITPTGNSLLDRSFNLTMNAHL